MKMLIDISDEWKERIEYNRRPNIIECGQLVESIWKGKILQKGNSRIFEEIVVEYPPADLCTYPEYKGKPYFSIKYEENGKHFIGFGTYKLEIFSQFLREYFIIPTIIEADKEVEDK